MYLTFKEKYKEFIVIRINLNIIRNNSEKYPYKEDDLYLKPNNVGHDNIIWMNCIYDYCVLHLRFKATNNFFSKVIFKPMKKVYREEKTRHWILITRTTIYRTFILSPEYPSIYIKEGAMLKGY